MKVDPTPTPHAPTGNPLRPNYRNMSTQTDTVEGAWYSPLPPVPKRKFIPLAKRLASYSRNARIDREYQLAAQANAQANASSPTTPTDPPTPSDPSGSVSPAPVAVFTSLQHRPQAPGILQGRARYSNEIARAKHDELVAETSFDRKVTVASKEMGKIGLEEEEKEVEVKKSKQTMRNDRRRKRKIEEKN